MLGIEGIWGRENASALSTPMFLENILEQKISTKNLSANEERYACTTTTYLFADDTSLKLYKIKSTHANVFQEHFFMVNLSLDEE